ncbi:MAG TPA: hypothetical protein PLP31_10390 [Thermoanaerobaculaceae bacterium]|nr:hypothetical protein [Thermoanaerobaculaceae bacterium]
MPDLVALDLEVLDDEVADGLCLAVLCSPRSRQQPQNAAAAATLCDLVRFVPTRISQLSNAGSAQLTAAPTPVRKPPLLPHFYAFGSARMGVDISLVRALQFFQITAGGFVISPAVGNRRIANAARDERSA